jgi:hypothetical protein
VRGFTSERGEQYGHDHFGLDGNDQLYWHGRKVRTSLPETISWLAWVFTGATVISAVVQLIELFLHWPHESLRGYS